MQSQTVLKTRCMKVIGLCRKTCADNGGHGMQLRGNVMGQVNEAEAEAEGARAQAEQEKEARRAQVQALLSDKAALLHQQQTALELQVCPFAFCNLRCHVPHTLQVILQPYIAAVTSMIFPDHFPCFIATLDLHETCW